MSGTLTLGYFGLRKTEGSLGKIQGALKKKKKNLRIDDLSTPGVGCCHPTGNYLPFGTVGGPCGSQRSAPGPSLSYKQRKKNMRCEFWGTGVGISLSQRLIIEACETHTAVRADRGRPRRPGWKFTPLLILWIPILKAFSGGIHSALFLRLKYREPARRGRKAGKENPITRKHRHVLEWSSPLIISDKIRRHPKCSLMVNSYHYCECVQRCEERQSFRSPA